MQTLLSAIVIVRIITVISIAVFWARVAVALCMHSLSWPGNLDTVFGHGLPSFPVGQLGF